MKTWQLTCSVHSGVVEVEGRVLPEVVRERSTMASTVGKLWPSGDIRNATGCTMLASCKHKAKLIKHILFLLNTNHNKTNPTLFWYI